MTLPRNAVWGILPLCACLYVWALPDERTPAGFKSLFAERGMQLISIETSEGCYRSAAYRYAARNQTGKVQRGLLCVNKSLRVFRLTSEPPAAD